MSKRARQARLGGESGSCRALHWHVVDCALCFRGVRLCDLGEHLDQHERESAARQAAAARAALPAAAAAPPAAALGAAPGAAPVTAGELAPATPPPGTPPLRACGSVPVARKNAFDVLRDTSASAGGLWVREPLADGSLSASKRSITWAEAELLGSPVTLVEGALGAEEAEELAKALLVDYRGGKLAQSQWVVFGNAGKTNRLSGTYELGESLEAAEAGARPRLNAPASMVAAAARLRAIVREQHAARAARAVAALHPFDAQGATRWSPSYCLVNLYRDGNDYIGAHGDGLSELGPRPIIAALSLGATRLFRWHKVVMRGESVCQGLTLETKAPHNSALIMWAPCQEEWKHEVPAQANADISSHHAVGGLVRLSLTFRMTCLPDGIVVPLCLCVPARRAWLRYSSRNDTYFWKCSPAGSDTSCNFYNELGRLKLDAGAGRPHFERVRLGSS